MMALYTVDASVFIAAFNPNEAAHVESAQLLDLLRKAARPVIAPTLVLPEVAGSIARNTGNPVLAARFVDRLAGYLSLVPIDASLARRAGQLAASARLRGADAVYGAVAEQTGSSLVTLDQQQMQRISGLVVAMTPSVALSNEAEP